VLSVSEYSLCTHEVSIWQLSSAEPLVSLHTLAEGSTTCLVTPVFITAHITSSNMVLEKYYLRPFVLIPVPCIFCYFVLWPTNAQLFHKLSHSYMFRHYCVILRELVVSTLPSYTVCQMQLLVIQFTI
jgi:hypothetical protein